MKHNCPNCGAPVYLDRRSCPYCETAYYSEDIAKFVRTLKTRSKLLEQKIEVERLYNEAINAMMTPNEIRRTAGLESVLYADDKPIAYSLPYFDIDCCLRLERIR